MKKVISLLSLWIFLVSMFYAPEVMAADCVCWCKNGSMDLAESRKVCETKCEMYDSEIEKVECDGVDVTDY